MKYIVPNNYGWIEAKLSQEQLDHIWDCIKTAKGGSYKKSLIGQIDKSFEIKDKNNYLWKNLIFKLVTAYGERFSHGHTRIPIEGDWKPYLADMWVNYQNATEYNPTHDHGGVYSFAAWLKQPVDYIDQCKIYNAKDANGSYNNTFNFQYQDLFGETATYMYQLCKEYEGTILLFPSRLKHNVYPYYESDEQRISISGNVWLK